MFESELLWTCSNSNLQSGAEQKWFMLKIYTRRQLFSRQPTPTRGHMLLHV